MTDSYGFSLSSSTEPDGTRHIRLQPYYQANYTVCNGQIGFRLRVEVTESVNMDGHIFRYYEAPVNAITGESSAGFSGVCSAVDMVEFPIGAPYPGANPKVFRLAFVDLVLQSQQEAFDVLSTIQGDTDNLIASLAAMDILVAQAPIWIGGEP